jgi:hypothetical protein
MENLLFIDEIQLNFSLNPLTYRGWSFGTFHCGRVNSPETLATWPFGNPLDFGGFGDESAACHGTPKAGALEDEFPISNMAVLGFHV